MTTVILIITGIVLLGIGGIFLIRHISWKQYLKKRVNHTEPASAEVMSEMEKNNIKNL